MSLESWYYAAGIGAFLVGLGGLAGLAVYAWDTRQMRRTGQEQLESSTRPCLLFNEKLDAGEVLASASYELKNVGAGTALNARWRYRAPAGLPWNYLPALQAGNGISTVAGQRAAINHQGMECEFDSLSGTRYRTTSTIPMDGSTDLQLRHTFERLSTLAPGLG